MTNLHRKTAETSEYRYTHHSALYSCSGPYRISCTRSMNRHTEILSSRKFFCCHQRQRDFLSVYRYNHTDTSFLTKQKTEASRLGKHPLKYWYIRYPYVGIIQIRISVEGHAFLSAHIQLYLHTAAAETFVESSRLLIVTTIIDYFGRNYKRSGNLFVKSS